MTEDYLKNDPHFAKDSGQLLSDWFGDKRHFRPWYDSDADYNTNSKSYYDYIAYRTAQLDYLIDALNKALSRNLATADTATVSLGKTGDWLQKDDLETLAAQVKLSADALNAIGARSDGIYAKDLQPELDSLKSEVRQILSAITSGGKVEIPREVDISGNPYLIQKVDLGDVTDRTRVAITGSLGSTRLTTSYQVGELKGVTSHLCITNTIDTNDSLQFSELFTRIVDGNKLWATVAHTFAINASSNKVTEQAKCYDGQGNPYYDSQSPDFADPGSEYQHLINIQKVVVYDLKDPIDLGQ